MTLVRLPAGLKDDLDWRVEDLSLEGPVLWEFDFACCPLSLEDPLSFHAHRRAVEHFTETVWKRWAPRAHGVILYRGDARFAHTLAWTEALRRQCADEEMEEDVYAATVFASYLHRLAAFLPDEVSARLVCAPPARSGFARALQLLSKERFAYVEVVIEGGAPFYTQDKSCPFGVCLPTDPYCTPDLLADLDALFSSLDAPFRVIPEAVLTEEWEGLETLLVMEGAVSASGHRKLCGFLAAGGKVEEKHRSRGIRTPDLLLPKQPR